MRTIIAWKELKKLRERGAAIARRLQSAPSRTRARDPEEARLIARAVDERAARSYADKFD